MDIYCTLTVKKNDLLANKLFKKKDIKRKEQSIIEFYLRLSDLELAFLYMRDSVSPQI
jgi:hypothetical protein